MPWHKRSIAHGRRDLPEDFEVVHPFHPLRGERFELITCRGNWDEDRVTFRDRKERLRALPARWTSLAPMDPFVVISEGRSLFHTQDLLALAAIIREVSERADRREGVK